MQRKVERDARKGWKKCKGKVKHTKIVELSMFVQFIKGHCCLQVNLGGKIFESTNVYRGLGCKLSKIISHFCASVSLKKRKRYFVQGCCFCKEEDVFALLEVVSVCIRLDFDECGFTPVSFCWNLFSWKENQISTKVPACRQCFFPQDISC